MANETFHDCMMCGRSVDAERAASLGGRHRFCSDRCLGYFDRGWDARRGPKDMVLAPGSTFAFYQPKSASGRSRSEAGKHRWRVARKAALAESWKKYQAKKKAEESSEQ